MSDILNQKNLIKQIWTKIPFSDKELDTYFDDIESYFFHIDLDNSQYGGNKLLTYIYNSGMKANIESNHFSDKLEELLLEYIKTNKIISIQSLNDIWTTILLNRINVKDFNGNNSEYNNFINFFIEKHRDIVDELLSVSKGLKTFLLNMVISDDDDSLPDEEICTKTFKNVGQNIVSLRNSIIFWDLLAKLETIDDYLYKEFVTDSFDGKKIAYFFFSEFNPLGILYMAKHVEKSELLDNDCIY